MIYGRNDLWHLYAEGMPQHCGRCPETVNQRISCSIYIKIHTEMYLLTRQFQLEVIYLFLAVTDVNIAVQNANLKT